MNEVESDVCRVCRCEGSSDKPLFYPCVCSGSIRYIHQDCLVQWLNYSRKEYCELCKHQFSFMPIYSPDMPKRLPVLDLVRGVAQSVSHSIRSSLHYTLVSISWLIIVPVTACRIYRSLLSGSLNSLLTLPMDILLVENIGTDCIQGCFVVACSLCIFISLVWIREQIAHGGGPDWLNANVEPQAEANQHANAVDRGIFNIAEFLGFVHRHQPVPNEAAQPVLPDANEDGNHDDDEEDVNEGNDDNVVNAADDIGQDDNWNRAMWDQAAEELTVERLLGLDGSLVFLEYIFWIISLNTLVILLFAFIPYNIGVLILKYFDISQNILIRHFEGALTTVLGYLVIAIFLVGIIVLLNVCRLKRCQYWLGACYIVLKVILLMIIEVGIFPLIFGWWLDICSLLLFGSSIKDRLSNFHYAPWTFTFIHWLIGMVYVFYITSFILLLKEVLRPGVLWFLRNLNDPDFSPVQEMITLPIYQHMRRFFASVAIFGTAVLFMVWLPVRTIHKIVPGFLPYNVFFVSSNNSLVSEFSLEILLLQVVLPAILEQGHTRMWLKTAIRWWTIAVGWLLGLKSYLLGDVETPRSGAIPAPPPNHNQEIAEVQQEGQALHAAHEAFFQRFIQSTRSYNRPSFFILRIVLLLLLVLLTLFIGSMVSFTFPIYLGRWIMSLWAGDEKVHELYTFACGLYTFWLSMRLISLLYHWVHFGSSQIYRKIKHWTYLFVKISLIGSILFGLVPLLLGILFELTLVIPVRVPLYQSPLFYPWQDWALGLLQTKLICAVTLIGPRNWLKTVLEQIRDNGLRNIDPIFILKKLCLPVVVSLGLALCIPYIITHSILPLFGLSLELETFIARQLYPGLFLLILGDFFFKFQIRQFTRLYEHIKNDKYLVGRRLQNYDIQSSQFKAIANPTVT